MVVRGRVTHARPARDFSQREVPRALLEDHGERRVDQRAPEVAVMIASGAPRGRGRRGMGLGHAAPSNGDIDTGNIDTYVTIGNMGRLAGDCNPRWAASTASTTPKETPCLASLTPPAALSSQPPFSQAIRSSRLGPWRS